MNRLFLTVLSVALVSGCASDVLSLGNSPNAKVRVEGTVTDPDGTPLKDVRVSLVVLNVSPTYDSDVTGDKGRYAVAATVLGAAFLVRLVQLLVRRDNRSARAAFMASNYYLLLLFAAMVADIALAAVV